MFQSSSHHSLNSTDYELKFGSLSPVSCKVLDIIAIYCILLMVVSIVSNSLLLFIFFRNKDLRSPINTMVMALTCLNLVGSCIELPIVITSHFMCRWPFGKLGCTISGFFMYGIGCTSCYFMMAMSFERFIIVHKPLSINSLKRHKILIVMSICILTGFFWALLPLLGWSHYSLERTLTSCSVEWAERSFLVLSYNMAILIFVFVLPFGTILATNLKILLIVRKMPKMFEKRASQKRVQKERILTKQIVIYISCFLISWTPYALASFYTVLTDFKLSPLLSLFPALFAKSSLVWSSLFYLLSNNQITKKVYTLFGMKNFQDASVPNENTLSEKSSLIYNY